MHTVIQSLRFSMRQLLKSPAFTTTVILTFALGIGATTATFSLIEGVLLRPLPFQDPDRIVMLGDHLGSNTGLGVTAREIATYLDQSSAFSSMGAFTSTSYELSSGSTPEVVQGARLTAGVFPTLAVQPAVGRVFSKQEEDAQKPLAVISYALWQDRYHRDPYILGTAIVLDRKTWSIIGVMPRNFEFPVGAGRLSQAKLWVPMSLTPEELSDQAAGAWRYQMIARLKVGLSLKQAAQDADRVAHQVMREFPAGMSVIHIAGDVKQLHEFTVEDSRPLLRTLFAAVCIVLLIACVNVAGLLLVRAIRRRREYALRLALGARAARIIRESVTDGLLLSLAGGLLGLGFAAIAIRYALHLLPDSMPRTESISMNPVVAAFGLMLAFSTGVLSSMAPAFVAVRTKLTESLKDGERTGTGARSHAWLRSTLVVSEIAIALTLLTTSGAFLRSYQKMLAVDPGFRADHVLVAHFQLPLKQYPTQTSSEAFSHSVLERINTQPGFVAAGISNTLPATDTSPESTFTVDGEPTVGWKMKFAAFNVIDGDYFKSLGIPLIEGRTFTPDDRSSKPLVVIVSQSMAKHAWPAQDAIGKRMHAGNPKKGYPWATVVGVVADTKLGSPDQPNVDQWYPPALQPAILYGSDYADALTSPASGYITLRAAMGPDQMIRSLSATVAGIDPLLALDQVQSMSDVLSEVEGPRRFNTDLITAFAVGALLLSVTGIYAVVAFSASMRTQEIAIRMALGAQRTGIVRLILVSGLKTAVLGCALGVIGSLAVARLLISSLFGVTATDPLIYVASVTIMLLFALLASALPARRAASTDPIEALRSI